MSTLIDRLDRTLRRNPLMPRVDWLRGPLRKTYHRFLNRFTDGMELRIGGVLPVRLPAEFTSRELQTYEPENATHIAKWVAEHPNGVFVDIGCSYGYFTCGVLHASESVRVIAIDADTPSLAITRHICQYASGLERLTLLRTLVGQNSESPTTRESIADQTSHALEDPRIKLDPRDTNYVNWDNEAPESHLPRIALDTLLRGAIEDDVPLLIKCDVEGAEHVVLDGMSETLRRPETTLLFSVHPQYLPKFDSSPDAIRRTLDANGYDVDVIGIDHEEHWLCTSRGGGVKS